MKYFIASFVLLFIVLPGCIAQQAGYYYDTAGNKIAGLIDFPGNGSILYKENKEAKKIRLTADDNINSFVVGIDSFAVLKDSTNAKRFAHILEDGRAKLYDYSMLFTNANNKNSKNENPYYYIEKGNKKYTINEIGWMYNFRKVMDEILSDYPEFENEYIKKNKLYIANLRYIIAKYNSHFRSVPIDNK
jgi:hypothetical protein